MSDEHPTTGPVHLPANPKAVADSEVSALSSLGNLHKPPTENEYEHAAFSIALTYGPEENIYAVLAHLDADAVQTVLQAATYLRSAARWVLADRRGPE